MNAQGSELLIVFFTVIILFVLLMMVLIYTGFLRKKSQLLLRQRENQLKFEQELAMSQIEMKEITLTHVGRELHDDLGQKLSVAKLLNNKLLTKLKDEEKNDLQEINAIVGECIQDIRNLSKTFITEQIEHFGLIDSLEREINRIKKLNSIKTEFSFNNHDVDINPKHALILFRIIQECITNVLKHSKARELKISVMDTPENLQIVINDNGIGFTTDEKKDGSGLKNMINRAKLIGTEFNINSREMLGTEIFLNYNK